MEGSAGLAQRLDYAASVGKRPLQHQRALIRGLQDAGVGHAAGAGLDRQRPRTHTSVSVDRALVDQVQSSITQIPVAGDGVIEIGQGTGVAGSNMNHAGFAAGLVAESYGSATREGCGCTVEFQSSLSQVDGSGIRQGARTSDNQG